MRVSFFIVVFPRRPRLRFSRIAIISSAPVVRLRRLSRFRSRCGAGRSVPVRLRSEHPSALVLLPAPPRLEILPPAPQREGPSPGSNLRQRVRGRSIVPHAKNKRPDRYGAAVNEMRKFSIEGRLYDLTLEDDGSVHCVVPQGLKADPIVDSEV